MSKGILSQVRQAITHLNPAEVRAQSEQPISIGLVAPTAEGLWRMERYFCPPDLSPAKRAEVSRMLYRISASERTRAYDIEIWDDSLAVPDHVFTFYPDRPERTVEEVLRRRPDLALPLARYISPFRKPVISQSIGTVARENALFSLATALPDIVPSMLSLPWAIGEFASDTAFLTGNQVRLTFLIAAASDREIGYREQKGQIGSIVAGAFGFRALARELVGKSRSAVDCCRRPPFPTPARMWWGVRWSASTASAMATRGRSAGRHLRTPWIVVARSPLLSWIVCGRPR